MSGDEVAWMLLSGLVGFLVAVAVVTWHVYGRDR